MKVLYLSSGAAHGAFQAGALKAIEESGWVPDLVMGVSVGAINGAGWVSGLDALSLIEMWHSLSTRDVYKMRPLRDWLRLWTWTHLVDTSPLDRFLLERLDMHSLYRSEKILAVTGMDIRTGKSHFFCSKNPTSLPSEIHETYHVSRLNFDSIVASGAIPGVFPWRNGIWDGALAQQQPLKPLVALGATEIMVVHMHVPYEDAPMPKNPLETAWRLADMATTYPLLKDLKLLEQRNDMLDFRNIDLTVICPEHPLGYSKVNFASPLKSDAIRHGYNVAKKVLF